MLPVGAGGARVGRHLGSARGACGERGRFGERMFRKWRGAGLGVIGQRGGWGSDEATEGKDGVWGGRWISRVW